MIDFVRQYKDWLILGITALFNIIAFIIFLLKNKSKRMMIINSIIEVLPDFINLAEKDCATGEGRLRYVVNHCLDYLSSHYGIDREVGFKKYYALIVSFVEKVLSTPQKKESRDAKK